MSFLEHLDELRKRLVNSVIIVVVAFTICWFVSDRIYDFLSVPIRQALSEAARRELPISGVTGDEKLLPLSGMREGEGGRVPHLDAGRLQQRRQTLPAIGLRRGPQPPIPMVMPSLICATTSLALMTLFAIFSPQ